MEKGWGISLLSYFCIISPAGPDSEKLANISIEL